MRETSFPYMQLARSMGIKYSVVLRVSDALDNVADGESPAGRDYGSVVVNAILWVWNRERLRRVGLLLKVISDEQSSLKG